MTAPVHKPAAVHHSTATKATGFIKIPNALVVQSGTAAISISHQDYARLLSLMCEGSSREGIDSLHRLVSQRRMNAAGAK